MEQQDLQVLRLNNAVFSDVPNSFVKDSADKVPWWGDFGVRGADGMLPFYFESYYRARPGDYKTYFLGISSAGYAEPGTLEKLVRIPLGRHDILENDVFAARASLHPNTLVVIEPFKDAIINYLINTRIGPSQRDVRDVEIRLPR